MERKTTHLVVIAREGVPEVTPFRSLEDAEEFFYGASAQWTESYLTSIVYGPGRPFSGTERSDAAGQRICAREEIRAMGQDELVRRYIAGLKELDELWRRYPDGPPNEDFDRINDEHWMDTVWYAMDERSVLQTDPYQLLAHVDGGTATVLSMECEDLGEGVSFKASVMFEGQPLDLAYETDWESMDVMAPDHYAKYAALFGFAARPQRLEVHEAYTAKHYSEP